MREILFRGKTDKGEWVEGYFCGKINKTFFAPAEDSTQILDMDLYWHEVIPETIGQYTGLTDKNGKKIFEGDILNCYSPNGVNDFRNRIVIWSELFLCFKAGKSPLYGDGLQIYEVIGNIYDNPELLRGDNNAE